MQAISKAFQANDVPSMLQAAVPKSAYNEMKSKFEAEMAKIVAEGVGVVVAFDYARKVKVPFPTELAARLRLQSPGHERR